MSDYDFTFAHANEGFDNHINNSIRGYENLIEDTINLSQYFVNNDCKVYDIGCSTGKMLMRMKDQNNSFAPYANYYGIELSDAFKGNMLETEKVVAEKYPNTGEFHLMLEDARCVDMKDASLITSIFTLQFMSLEDRKALVRKIYDSLKPDGAFIFAEKYVPSLPRLHQMMTFMYYDYKRQFFTGDEILDKEKTLRHMLKPLEKWELMDMIDEAGFTKVEQFWQNHTFVGYIAIK